MTFVRVLALMGFGTVSLLQAQSSELEEWRTPLPNWTLSGTLALDSQNNVYVDASDIWALGVAAGPDDSVYVTGKAGPATCPGIGFPASLETYTVKYDAAGTQLWHAVASCSSVRPNTIGLTSDCRVVINTTMHVIRYLQNPGLVLGQPGGPGTGAFVENTNLHVGNEYNNIFSLESCATASGSGPYLGLCVSDPQSASSYWRV